MMILNRKTLISALSFLLTAINGISQDKPAIPSFNQFADITATAGSSQGALAFSYVYNWKTGEKKKFELGLGLRSTIYSGTKKDYITAPAKLSRSNTIPFAIVFAGQETQNWDTLTVQRPFTNSINITGNLGYNFFAKILWWHQY